MAERRPDDRLGQPVGRSALTSAIEGQLGQSPYIKSCLYKSQAFDYNEAKSVLPADELAATAENQYPASYRCELVDPSEAPAVYQAFHGKPGVFDVKYPGQQIKTMQNVIRVVQWVFLAIAVVLLLSASVLILNTIRMAIFARRREVSVMKLVGATNWFIRLPFMAEGMIQGLLGAGVAVLVVLSLYWGIGLDQGQDRGRLEQHHPPDGAERVGGLRDLPARVAGGRGCRRDRFRLRRPALPRRLTPARRLFLVAPRRPTTTS